MVSSRQLTTFSDYRLPPSTPDFLTTDDYCRYLDRYCEKFNLFPHIHLDTRVTSIQRQPSGIGHAIHTLHMGKASQWSCDAVAICSGLHVTPNIPDIPGLSNVPKVFHSSRFKGVQQLGVDMDVLILGSGETGMDIAYRAVKADTRSVTLSHRDGFMCASKAIIQNHPSLQVH
ncbi:hypothetical protein K3495_g10082 [Podosphaera aphanis]|nr:hypothetical protein K3495_g10082 [Podosphaera aphanis]